MRRTGCWTVAVVAVLLVAASLVVVVHRAREVAGTVAVAKAQATAGARSLAARDTTAAAAQFTDASQRLALARHALGPEWVASAASKIPWAGRQYLAARALIDIGLDGTKAGVAAAEVLQASQSAYVTANHKHRVARLLAATRGDIETALASLADASDRVAGLSADGLVAPLAEAVRSVEASLGVAAPLLERSRPLLELESYLLSGSHRILVVSQDGAELRPTGGFIGSYGIVDVGPKGVRLEKYQDVYALPDPPGRVKPPPGGRTMYDFGFRDANWWIDFPTSAQTMLGFWRAAKQPRVDGIIAIDTVTMKYLLAAVGPVHVPSHKETFTSENLLQRLLYLVEIEGVGKGVTGRNDKRVLAALAERLEQRMLGADPEVLVKSAQALARAANEKHLQVYLTDLGAEAAVDALGWSGRVSPPLGATDTVAVSNAMYVPGKVNFAMRKRIDYEVGLNPDRSADTTLSLGYSNTGAFPLPLFGTFGDWVRVYRAPGTVFTDVSIDGRVPTTMTEFGFPAEVRRFRLRRGQEHTETLTARISEAVRTDQASGASAGSLDYELYLVRQADIEEVPVTVTVKMPPGWRTEDATARLVAARTAVPVLRENNQVRVKLPLTGDLGLHVRLVQQ